MSTHATQSHQLQHGLFDLTKIKARNDGDQLRLKDVALHGGHHDEGALSVKLEVSLMALRITFF